MAMTWIVLVTLVLALAALIAAKQHSPSPPPADALDGISDEEIVRAAVELHDIDQRFTVAWTRHELRGEADRLRRELTEEMRRVEALEAANHLEE